jgi:GT2 family glycosyltransferase
MPKVSIIMVTYNGLMIGTLVDSIASVLRTRFPDIELVIVDNGSSDGSVDFLKSLSKEDSRVKTLFKNHNSGYSAANNLGVRYAKGEFLAFLHNDARVDPSWLDELLDFMNTNENIGAVQPQIRDLRNPETMLSEGNSMDSLGFVFVEGLGERVNRQASPKLVFALTAACMLFRRPAFEAVGGFDENYFFSYDEIDLCWRTWLAGYQLYYVPQAIIWHRASTTVDQFFKSQVPYFDCKNRLNSMIKNYEADLLARYLIPSVLASMVIATRKLAQGNLRGAISIARALVKTLFTLNETLRKRRYVQSTRKIPDSDLLAERLIIPTNFARLYQRLTRVS